MVEVILLKFADGVLELECFNGSVKVGLVGRKFTIVVSAIDAVTLGITHSARLEALTVTFLAPRLLATACLG